MAQRRQRGWLKTRIQGETWASIFELRTDSKTVQTLLRHSDVKLTLQFYSHAVSEDRMVAAGEMLTAILSHAVGQSGLRAD